MWPTWSEPLTVGGGVSIEKTSARSAVRSKAYVPCWSHAAPQRASRPSRVGFSGTFGAAMVGQRYRPPSDPSEPVGVRSRGGQRRSVMIFGVSVPPIHLYDTRRRAVVPFEPIVAGQVGIYTCGPTV